MITIELTENEVSSVVIVLDWAFKFAPASSDPTFCSILKDIKNVSRYAEEELIKKRKGVHNDSKGMGTTTTETVREGDDPRREQCWHNTVIGSNLRTSLGRPAENIGDQEAGSQPVGKG